MEKKAFDKRTVLPLVSLGIVVALHKAVPVSADYMLDDLPYYTWLLYALAGIFAVWAAAGVFAKKARESLGFKAAFVSAAFLLLEVYELLTIKFTMIPVLYFPAPEKIMEAFVVDGIFILRCLVYSLRLLIGGFLLGALAGVFTGTLIGWNKRAHYWIMPLIRVVGPIPSTAWIPVALIVFTQATDASIFLIALGVWFPTTILTSSGIMNIPKSYFEVSSTLGSSVIRNIFSIALPGAAPSIFTGLFNGTSASFLTLMAAEMIGCKFGIGWYINWQRETLAYANVYAALIVIAVTFSLLIGAQFRIRDRALSWQKGTIRW
jgi:NitT/TauT family transport system permease protein